MTQPAGHDYAPLSGWLPFAIEPRAQGPAVHWVDPGTDPFAEPFFDRSISRLLKQPNCRVATTGVDALVQLPELAPHLRPKALIFHIGRSGSTLLANALKALERCLVVSEPLAVNNLLLAAENDAWREPWAARLTGLVACLGQPRRPSQVDYFLKFSSFNTLYIEQVCACFPDVPWIVLYRDPVEIVVSLLKRPPGWLNHRENPERAAVLAACSSEEVRGISDEVFAGRVLERLFEAAVAALDGTGRALNYADLTTRALDHVLPHLGLVPGETELAVMANTFSVHAKDSQQRRFEPDAQQKQASATSAVRQVCEERLATPFHALQNHPRRVKIPAAEIGGT